MRFLYLFILITILFACQDQDVSQTPPPNIVLIFTDDQGYADLGCYGSANIKTPNIDGIAKSGIQFNNFYVSQGVCSASRASMLTGCYANRIGINGAFSPNVGRGLHPQEETIAEILKPLGYKSAIYGKWHLGSEKEFLPTRQGFDEYFGIPYSNDMWPFHPWQGSVFNFPGFPLIENETAVDTLTDQSQITTWYTEKAVSFIERNAEAPFFLYVPHSMPHVPLYVSESGKGRSEGGLYGDVIEEIDWSVGEILKSLKENGLEENTLVIFTSDNGPWLAYGDHSGSALPLREGKGTALEGGVRVPCVMQWPNKIAAGQVSERPAMTIDILPTIAKITGASLPKQPIDGKAMDQLWFQEKQSDHHQAYYFYYRNNELHAVLSGNGKWKLYLPHKYRSLNGRVGTNDGLPIDYNQNQMSMELYNLETDISEKVNVFDQNPEIVEQLLIHVESARSELGDALTDRKGRGTRRAGVLSEILSQ